MLELRVSPSELRAPQEYSPELSRSKRVNSNTSLDSPDMRIPCIERIRLFLSLDYKIKLSL